MADDIDEFIDELLVDAYDDGEQLTSFEEAFRASARFPFPARIVGTAVDVVKVEFAGDARRGLTALCRREGDIHHVSLADLTPGPVPLETARLLEAYRHWLGLPAFDRITPGATGPGDSWTYWPVSSEARQVDNPLALEPVGTWDPADQYWGEPGIEIHPYYQAIIAAGPRPAFEMEQVIPAMESDDWEIDPVADAAELHRSGYDREATALLNRLIALDEGCIDAWVHLGVIAFDTKGPKAALELYDTAVAIGEAALPYGFAGVLPRGFVDNRPFHRALHGLGLCAWRQRRWVAAETIFTNLLWIDGAQTWNALECLLAVEQRQRWTRN